jgi:hypothetical protein
VPVQDATAGSTATSDGISTGTGMASTADPVVDGTTSAASTAALDTSEATTMAPESSSSTTGEASSGSSGGSTTGAPLTVLNHPAALAECNDPINLDPEVCKVEASPTPAALLVDLEDTGIGPFNGYLRFDLDGAVDPDLVVSVTLRMTVTSVSTSSSTGAVYLVEPFELMDLYAIQPASIGPALAPDQGAVVGNDVVEWSLPPDLLPLGEPSLYLGILAQSTDGVDYWNLAGAQPPELVIEQQG